MKLNIAMSLHSPLSRAHPLAVPATAALAGTLTMGVAGGVTVGETLQNPPATISTTQQGELRGGATAAIQGYRLGEARVVGARAIPREAILSSLGMVSGDGYDESKLRKGFEDVKKSYGVIGFVTVRIEPVLALDDQRTNKGTAP